MCAGYRAIETAESDRILHDPLAALLGGAEWVQRLNQTTKVKPFAALDSDALPGSPCAQLFVLLMRHMPVCATHPHEI